jgi:hypothetical protein
VSNAGDGHGRPEERGRQKLAAAQDCLGKAGMEDELVVASTGAAVVDLLDHLPELPLPATSATSCCRPPSRVASGRFTNKHLQVISLLHVSLVKAIS